MFRNLRTRNIFVDVPVLQDMNEGDRRVEVTADVLCQEQSVEVAKVTIDERVRKSSCGTSSLCPSWTSCSVSLKL